MLGLSVRHTMLGMIIGHDWSLCPLSLSASRCRFEPRSQVPWKEHRLGSETNLDPNSNYEKLLLGDSSEILKVQRLWCLVKIETVSSQGPVFKDQVIWNHANERHVQYTCMVFFPVKRGSSRDFSSTPVVKTPKAGGTDLIPGRGTKIPHASRCSQKNVKRKKNFLKYLLFREQSFWAMLTTRALVCPLI